MWHETTERQTGICLIAYKGVFVYDAAWWHISPWPEFKHRLWCTETGHRLFNWLVVTG